MGETYWKGYTQGAYHGTDEWVKVKELIKQSKS